jgi:CRP-like cAMP-binding protein
MLKKRLVNTTQQIKFNLKGDQLMPSDTFNFLNLARADDEVMRISAGETIIEIGKPGDKMYVLKSGHAQVRLFNGKHIVDLKPGMLIGLVGLLDGRDYEDTTVAVTDCELIAISKGRAEFLVQEHPTFGFQLMQVIVDRFYYVMGILKKECHSDYA